jgi:hypothetical protein
MIWEMGCNRAVAATILIASILLSTIKAYPEKGFLAKSSGKARKDFDPNVWNKIESWVLARKFEDTSPREGFFNYGSDLDVNGEEFTVDITGIYFISAVVPVSGVGEDKISLALVINGKTNRNELSLLSEYKSMVDGEQTITLSGFVKMYADEKMSIQVFKSSAGTSKFSVSQYGSLTFHFVSRTRAVSSFLAHLESPLTVKSSDTTVQLGSSANANPLWQTSDSSHLFQSSNAFVKDLGNFISVCDGVYMLTTNIIIDGPAGKYNLAVRFGNDKDTKYVATTAENSLNKQGILTLSIYKAFNVVKGTFIDLAIQGNGKSFTVLKESSWTMSFVGADSENYQEFASFSPSDTEQEFIVGSGLVDDQRFGVVKDFVDKSLLEKDAPKYDKKGQFAKKINPVVDEAVGRTKFFLSNVRRSDLFYVTMNIHLYGDATVGEVVAAVAADERNVKGSTGIYAKFTKSSDPNAKTTVSLAGIVHIRSGTHLSFYVRALGTTGQKLKLGKESFISVVNMRYAVSSISAQWHAEGPSDSVDKYTVQKKITNSSEWYELGDQSPSADVKWDDFDRGRFTFGTDFNAKKGRFTASHSGIHTVMVNLVINKQGENGIKAVVGIDGDRDAGEASGLFAIETKVNSGGVGDSVMHIYGTVFLRQDQYLSVFVQVLNEVYNIKKETGFSVSYIGPLFYEELRYYGVSKGTDQDVVLNSGNKDVDDQNINGVVIEFPSIYDEYGKKPWQTNKYKALAPGIYQFTAMIIVDDAILPNKEFIPIYLTAIIHKEGQKSKDDQQIHVIEHTYQSASTLGDGRTAFTFAMMHSVDLVDNQFSIQLKLSHKTDDTVNLKISKQSRFTIFKASERTNQKLGSNNKNINTNFPQGILQLKSVGVNARAKSETILQDEADFKEWRQIQKSNFIDFPGGIVDQSGYYGLFELGKPFYELANTEVKILEPAIYSVTAQIKIQAKGSGSVELGIISSQITSSENMAGVYDKRFLTSEGHMVTLTMAGNIYVTRNQEVGVSIKTTIGIEILSSSTFSMLKLQEDTNVYGVIAEDDSQTITAAKNEVNFEKMRTDKYFGLVASNIGYQPTTASGSTYRVQHDGLYKIDLSVNIGSSPRANLPYNMYLYNDETNTNYNSYGDYGSKKSLVTSRLVYLTTGNQITGGISSLDNQPITNTQFTGGMSVYYLRSPIVNAGYDCDLTNSVTLGVGETELSDWTVRGPTATVATPDLGKNAASQRATIKQAGIYLITFTVVFEAATEIEVSAGVFVENSDVNIKNGYLIYGKKTASANNRKTVISLTNNVNLVKDDVVSFKVSGQGAKVVAFSLGDRDLVNTATFRSMLLLYPATGKDNHNGLSARLTKDQPYTGVGPHFWKAHEIGQDKNDYHGTYKYKKDVKVDAKGEVVILNPAVMHATMTVVIRNNKGSDGVFGIQIEIPGVKHAHPNLVSKATIPGNKFGTLSVASSVAMEKYQTMKFTILSDDADADFTVLKDSSLSTIVIDDNTGPVLCEDFGLNVNNLNPQSVRVRVGQSYTYTCSVLGAITPSFSWLRNMSNVPIPDKKGKELTVTATSLDSTDKYQCRASFQDTIKDTPPVDFVVYDPTPVKIDPRRNPSRLYTYIDENSSPKTVGRFGYVGQQKSGETPKLRLQVMSGGRDTDGIVKFGVGDPSTGPIDLRTTHGLDYEKTRIFNLTLRIFNEDEDMGDGKPKAQTADILFTVYVRDVNDEKPKFEETVIVPTPEDIAPGSPVFTVTATDADSKVHYALIGKSSNDKFTIGEFTGVITLKSDQQLDRETLSQHTIVVSASDKDEETDTKYKHQTVSEIVLQVTDVNDNDPHSKQMKYDVRMSEKSVIGRQVVTVHAHDPDYIENGTVVYSLQNDFGGTFKIFQNGTIILSAALDYETTTNYALKVDVRDSGSQLIRKMPMPITINVQVVDLNDNNLVTQDIFTADVSENAGLNTNVVRITPVDDKDISTQFKSIQYKITDPSAEKLFQIDNNGFITLKGNLDYETAKEHRFSVKLTENRCSFAVS